MSKITPGPWFTISGGRFTYEVSNSVGPDWASDEHHVCSGATKDNARVIAMLPELIGVLHEILRDEDGICHDVKIKVQSILARIDGRKA